MGAIFFDEASLFKPFGFLFSHRDCYFYLFHARAFQRLALPALAVFAELTNFYITIATHETMLTRIRRSVRWTRC